MAIDPDQLKLAQLQVFKIKEGEMVAVMLHLGHRLGLFAGMASGVPMTSAELAEATGLQERWIQEWLLAVTAARFTQKEGDTFFLSPEMAAVLAEADHPNFVAGIFPGPIERANVDRLAESFKTGIGSTWGSHGALTAAMQASMSGNAKRTFLVDEVIAAMDGLTERLTAGVRVVDVGCGTGASAAALARAFPKSTVLGIEPSDPALDVAFADQALAKLDNLSFCKGTFDDLPPNSADLVLTLDVLHDLPRPMDAVHAVKQALDDQGRWMVADIKAAPDFEGNLKNPVLALFYSMSVAYCMNSALSEPGGEGLGTMGLHEEKLRELATAAGFTSVTGFEFDFDASNRYYEIF